jgi:anti-anti-sigma factor
VPCSQARTLADTHNQAPTSTTVAQGNAVVVHLRGEFDCDSVASLTAILDAGAALGGALLVVDLSRVGFMDSATVRVLELAAEKLAGHSRTLALRSPTPAGRRIIGLCGAARLLEPDPAAG